jgi:hypothetical protein
MQIKKYQTWLTEKLNQDCGCSSTTFEVEPIIEQAPANKPSGYKASETGQSSQLIQLNYAAGWYSIDHTNKRGETFTNSTKIKLELDKVIQFLKANPGSYIASATMTSGESIIPNYDSEGKAGKLIPKLSAKTGKQLDMGDLSDLRAAALEAWLKEQLAALVTDGTVKRQPYVAKTFVDAKTTELPSGGWPDYSAWIKAGAETTSEKGKKYAELKKGYDADQSTTIRLVIRPYADESCLSGLWIGFHYDVANGHNCNNARFTIKANGIQLTTVAPPTAYKLSSNVDNSWALPAGLPYASLNNNGGQFDDFQLKTGLTNKSNSESAFRLNWFRVTPQLAKSIAAAAQNGRVEITATCTGQIDNPRDGGKGYKGQGGCHTTAPHVYILSNKETITTGFPTYPNTNDGIIAKTDFCGRNLGSQINTLPKTTKDGTGTAQDFQLPKETGIKLPLGAKGTLRADQRLVNMVNTKQLYKKPDGTHLVLKPFKENGISYLPGDTISGELKAGVKFTPPAGRVDPATAPKP